MVINDQRDIRTGTYLFLTKNVLDFYLKFVNKTRKNSESTGPFNQIIFSKF